MACAILFNTSLHFVACYPRHSTKPQLCNAYISSLLAKLLRFCSLHAKVLLVSLQLHLGLTYFNNHASFQFELTARTYGAVYNLLLSNLQTARSSGA
ncbi:MAG: hypothetical protein RL660_2621 [Bacteroidota bacterium]|jgi:hypothetical protein